MNKKICFIEIIVLTTILLIPSLAAANGNITISSVPSGATVFLDSGSTGATTPTTIEGVSSGTHYILLRLTGYQDYTEIVAVSNNATSTVTGILIALTTTTQEITNGSIKVESNPSNAAVFLNTEYQGKTPLTLYNISHGTHRVLVQKIGYQDWSERISVTSGTRTDVYATLQAEATETTVTTTITTATTVKTTVSRTSTAKVPTSWPTSTSTPASPMSVFAIFGAVGLGLMAIRK
jgi:nicotinamide riboside transporter PnuC